MTEAWRYIDLQLSENGGIADSYSVYKDDISEILHDKPSRGILRKYYESLAQLRNSIDLWLAVQKEYGKVSDDIRKKAMSDVSGQIDDWKISIKNVQTWVTECVTRIHQMQNTLAQK